MRNILKGREALDRIKNLMGESINKTETITSNLEYTKKAPNGKVYGIVKENSKYFIKVAEKITNKENLVENFQYIDGLRYKMNHAFPSYIEALKHINSMFSNMGATITESLFVSDSLSNIILENEERERTNYWEGYDFETKEQFFDYIVESYLNGQFSQMKNLYNDVLPANDKREFLGYLESSYSDELSGRVMKQLLGGLMEVEEELTQEEANIDSLLSGEMEENIDAEAPEEVGLFENVKITSTISETINNIENNVDIDELSENVITLLGKLSETDRFELIESLKKKV
jgi:hypothetical protein